MQGLSSFELIVTVVLSDWCVVQGRSLRASQLRRYVIVVLGTEVLPDGCCSNLLDCLKGSVGETSLRD